MLTGGAAPCLPGYSIYKLNVQGRWDDNATDDLVVYAKQDRIGKEAKLLAQVKHDVSLTATDRTFAKVIQDAWRDFSSDDFDTDTDRIALITGPLRSADTNHMRPILEWARHSASADEFLKKVSLPYFSSDAKRKKLEAFRTQLKAANGDTDVSDEQLWKFLKAFHLIGYDLDTESGGTLALLHSLIARYADGSIQNVWSRVIDVVQSFNQNAGTITLATLPEDIVNTFSTADISDWSTDIAKLEDHRRYILEGVRTTVGDVHVEQKDALAQLLEATETSNFVFVTGERGVGKSSLAREFADHASERAPLFYLRAEDLDKPHLDNVFSAIGLRGTLSDLEAGFALMPKKYFIIESLEKVLELESQAAFTDLLHLLKKQSGWTVVATGRDYAYQPITFHYLQPSGVSYSSLPLEGFSDEQVQSLCQKVPTLQKLTANPVLLALVKTPFLADLAHRTLAAGTEFSPEDGEKEFRAAVWRDVIADERHRSSGLPIKRRRTFIDVAVTRAKRMVYGVPEGNFDSEVVLKLEADNLLRRDKEKGVVSPAHDVLEDWALERFIEEAYQTHSTDIQAFLDAVGHEPAMNRAFRLWLHQKLRLGDDVGDLVHALLNTPNIQRFWQDEAIAAILQGDNPEKFLSMLRVDLLSAEHDLLQRFCFVLRIACQVPEQTRSTATTLDSRGVLVDALFLKPFGKGWEAVIHFLYEHRGSISEPLLPHVVEVLNGWVSGVNADESPPELSRETGLLALHLLEGLKDVYRDKKEVRKKLLKIIIWTSPKCSQEFEGLLNNDVFVEKVRGRERRPAYVKDFCEMAFSLPETLVLCKFMPDLLIKLAKHEWFFDFSAEEEEPWYARSHIDVAECFGLHEHRRDFFPASGAKGPFKYLLNLHPRKGLDFLLELFNRSAEKYAHSTLDAREHSNGLRVDLSEPAIEKLMIHLNDGNTIQQFYSGRFWSAYRGHSVIPYLLQSALMALENWLVESIEHSDSKAVAWVFDYILRNSNSIMPTAVLASVATGFPEKVGKAALPLLRTPELYLMENGRRVHDMARGSFSEYAWINDPLAKLYAEERHIANQQPWRNECLETLCVRFQFLPNLKDDALEAVDMLRASAPDFDMMRFLLHRIDTRNWEVTPGSEEGTYSIAPKSLEPELLKIQSEFQKEHYEWSRFSSLFFWALQKYKQEPVKHETYASNEEALAEAKALLEKLETREPDDSVGISYEGIPITAAVLLRDHANELTEEDISWCFDVIRQTLEASADAEDSFVDALSHDALGAAASVLPIVLDFATGGEKIAVKGLIAVALTHANEHIRHGAANGIRQHLWTRDPDFAQSCIEGSVEYARFEHSHRHERHRARFLEDDEKAIRVAELQSEKDEFRRCFTQGELSASTEIRLDTHSPHHLLLPCLMIPDGSTESEHVKLLSELPRLFFEIEQKQRDYRSDDNGRIDYEAPSKFARRFADYLFPLIESGLSQYDELLKEGCEGAPSLIKTLDIHIAVEAERRNEQETYWKFWLGLSDKVQQIATESSKARRSTFGRDNRRGLVRSMLKADVDWQPVDFESQNIAFGKEPILEFVRNAGKNPDVFEALARLMYYFPAIFLESGIRVLAEHQKEVGGTDLLANLNTTFYLERSMQRFLQFDSAGPLAKNMHESCLILLDAVVENASARGYYLREHLVRSRRIA